jgi:DNA topoisomerase III
MKTVVFAEKPSVAAEIARVLKCNKKEKGFYEGEKYVITWALGHLAGLLDPEDYDKRYATWDMATLPIIPPKMKLKVLKQTSQQYRTVEFLLKRKDINELIIATDAGREGELVARWTMQLAGFNKPFRRLWISSQTDRAIAEGFAKLKPGKDYDRLFNAAVCRAEADWLIGLNISRALTCQFNTSLSAGRVQTPTLSMIVAREEEIQHFKPTPFWEVKAEFEGFFGHWRTKENPSGRIFDMSKAESLKEKLENKSGTVVSADITDRSEMPPLAYDLTELQRDANNKYGFSAKKTLSLMQSLYESYKLVTYPRTDSRYITSDMVDTLKDRLIIFKGTSYERFAAPLMSKPLKITKRFVDDTKVSDHHAIIPTEQKPELSKLSVDEIKIYDLIVKRFLAVLSPDYQYREIKLSTVIEGESFYSKGKEVISLGWREITTVEKEYDPNSDELPEQSLTAIKKGSVQKLKKINIVKSNTKPPARYTEADLLSKMEKGNLGTPATRADIIEKIISSFYVERNGRQFSPTSKGKQLISIVPQMLKSPDLTAEWELKLEAIAKGNFPPEKFNDEIKRTTKELIESVKCSEVTFKLDNITKEKCPLCGKYMLKVKDKRKREMLICQDRECGHREAIGGKFDKGLSVSKRDQVMNKKAIAQHADNEVSTGLNLGDLFKNFK